MPPLARHLRRLHALTGATRATFTYDGAGRLAALTDGDGNVTTIERDAQGKPTAIVAPHGQRTVLILDGNGYLASVTDPGGNATAFTYSSDGLLSTKTTPWGHLYEFAYDALGRLTRDGEPAGISQSLTLPTNQAKVLATKARFTLVALAASGKEVTAERVAAHWP